MDKHSKEPWVLWNDGDGILMDGCISPKKGGIALMCCNEMVGGRYAKANARRIVACVNACRGLPTDELEHKGLVAAVGTHLIDVEQQRDELLAALEGVLAIVTDSEGVAGYHLNGDIAEWGEFDEINAANDAIAKAKGGAA